MAVKRTGCSHTSCDLRNRISLDLPVWTAGVPGAAIRLIEHTTVLPTSRHDRVRCRAIDALRSVGLEDSHRYRPAVAVPLIQR